MKFPSNALAYAQPVSPGFAESRSKLIVELYGLNGFSCLTAYSTKPPALMVCVESTFARLSVTFVMGFLFAYGRPAKLVTAVGMPAPLTPPKPKFGMRPLGSAFG